MNSDKAREFFSSYYEGTIEKGLKQAFERQLSVDAQIQAEYQAFEKTMKQLDDLKVEIPEPEYDLHDRIMARLDRHLLDEKKKPAPWFGARLRNLITIGAMSLVLIGAAISIRIKGPTFWSGLFGTNEGFSDQLSITVRDEKPTLVFCTAEKKTVTVSLASSGKVLSTTKMDGRGLAAGQTMRSPLNYQAESTTLLKVSVQGDRNPTYIALPGSLRDTKATGNGNISDLALAISNYYHIVVVIATDTETRVEWDFSKNTDPVSSANDSLKGTDRGADLRTNRVLWIH